MVIETSYKILTSDFFALHGVLTSCESSKVVICPVMSEQEVHSAFSQSVMKYFIQNGYDVLRIAFSHTENDARRFSSLTLGHMADDIRSICTHLGVEYDSVFLIAHGLNAFAAALANPVLDSMSLLEPCFVPYENFIESHYAFDKSLGLYQNLHNPVAGLHAPFVESCKLFDHKTCRSLVQSIERPLQFIWAEKGLGKAISELYRVNLTTHAEGLEIESAGHNFHEFGVLDTALNQAFTWFNYCSYMYDLSALELPTSSRPVIH